MTSRLIRIVQIVKYCSIKFKVLTKREAIKRRHKCFVNRFIIFNQALPSKGKIFCHISRLVISSEQKNFAGPSYFQRVEVEYHFARETSSPQSYFNNVLVCYVLLICGVCLINNFPIDIITNENIFFLSNWTTCFEQGDKIKPLTMYISTYRYWC